MAQRITDKMVKDLEPPAAGNRITYDDKIKGFGIRITVAGTKVFIFNYRVKGNRRERRYTIGGYPKPWTVQRARKKAEDLKRDVDNGKDPMGDLHAERGAPTMADLADRYLKDHAVKKRSERDDKSIISNIVTPGLGRLKVVDVRYADVDRLHRKMKAIPYRANRTVSLLSKMFNLAIKWDMRADNPAKGIERYPEEKRERFLSTDEIQRLSAALADQSNQTAANAVRLLMLTGSRRGEVLSATWDQFDLAAGVWTKPSAHTKQKKEHRVPLSAPAVQLLTEIAETTDGDYVFPGRNSGEPLKELKGFWTKVCKAARVTGVRVHDLRHSYASILASHGYSLPMIGALLGHTQPGTTARYAHLFDEPLREATECVGEVITMNGDKGGEVVPLHGGRTDASTRRGV